MNQLADDRHPIFDDFPMEHQELVFYEVDQGGSPYSGRPNARTEKAWDELLNGSCVPSEGWLVSADGVKVGIISITAEEHDRFHGPTAPDRRNDGRYVVVLDMFHQLHCVVSNLTLCLIDTYSCSIQRFLRNQVFNPRAPAADGRVAEWEVHMGELRKRMRLRLN